MHGRAPKAIITDQCRSMAIAIERVFPNTKHRLCLWHIMKKLPAKLGAHTQYHSIKHTMKNIVYNSITIDQCHYDWMRMVNHFKLEDNNWLNSLYRERRKWLPVYVKQHFWAGMSTSQRSESMNAFFDDFVHAKTSLKQFVEQYDRALKRNIEKELKLDFRSYNSSLSVVGGYALERQFHSLYTNDVLKIFQAEVAGMLFCDICNFQEEGENHVFEVLENILGSAGETLRDVRFKVHYRADVRFVHCQCQLFEFRGILCRHILIALKRLRVDQVHERYVLDRWRKDLKRGYQHITNIYDPVVSESQRKRFDSLTATTHLFQQLASQSEDKTSDASRRLKAMIEEYMLDSNPPEASPRSTPPNKVIHSPVRVRARGRPPTKRKQSAVEKVINKYKRGRSCNKVSFC